MSLLILRNAIATDLEGDARLTGLTPPAQVTVHSGRFDEDSVRRYAKLCPAVIVTCLGTKPGMKIPAGRMIVCAKMAAFCLAKHQSGVPAEDSVLELVDATMRALNPWDGASLRVTTKFAKNPQNLESRNLYTGGLDKKYQLGLWAVTWDHDIELQDTLSLDDLKEVRMNWDLDPLVSEGDPEYEAQDIVDGLEV